MSSSEVKNKITGSKNYGKLNASLLPFPSNSKVNSEGTAIPPSKIYIDKFEPATGTNGIVEGRKVPGGLTNGILGNTLDLSNWFDAGIDPVPYNPAVVFGSFKLPLQRVKSFTAHVKLSGSLNILDDDIDIPNNTENLVRRVDLLFVITNSANKKSTFKQHSIDITIESTPTGDGPGSVAFPSAFQVHESINCGASLYQNTFTEFVDSDNFVVDVYYASPKDLVFGRNLCLHDGITLSLGNRIYSGTGVRWSTEVEITVDEVN